uniref:Non-specific serine/threonine protein kinase n=1 Tax=Panagrolaimus davidi TaxID=227884 RepID=A0A914QWL8_9BILA
MGPFPQSSKDREENEYFKAVFMIEMGGKQLEDYLINTPEKFLSIFSQVCSFMATEHGILFNDIKNDSDLFGQALRGDPIEHDLHQKVYDQMETANGKDWKKFTPATNVFWLKYLVQKLTGFDENGDPSIFPPTEAVQATIKKGEENPLEENVRKEIAAEIYGKMKSCKSAIEIFVKLVGSELFKDVLKQS